MSPVRLLRTTSSSSEGSDCSRSSNASPRRTVSAVETFMCVAIRRVAAAASVPRVTTSLRPSPSWSPLAETGSVRAPLVRVALRAAIPDPFVVLEFGPHYRRPTACQLYYSCFTTVITLYQRYYHG